MGGNYTLQAHASHAPSKFSDAVLLHLIFFAQAQYNIWCNKTGFVRKLPSAVKEVKYKNQLWSHTKRTQGKHVDLLT